MELFFFLPCWSPAVAHPSCKAKSSSLVAVAGGNPGKGQVATAKTLEAGARTSGRRMPGRCGFITGMNHGCHGSSGIPRSAKLDCMQYGLDMLPLPWIGKLNRSRALENELAACFVQGVV